MAKFVSVNRDDGFVWLAFEFSDRRIYLHRQGRQGDLMRPGQRCSTHVLLEQLGKDARPRSDDDYGSIRQVNAENIFFAAVEEHRPGALDDDYFFWALKATTDEMIDEALKRVRTQ